jgi:hypothetical protein
MVNIEYLDSEQDKELVSFGLGGSYRISLQEDINKEGRSVYKTRVPSSAEKGPPFPSLYRSDTVPKPS